MRVTSETTITLTEDEGRKLALDLHRLKERGQMGGLLRLSMLSDALNDRGLGVHHRTRSYPDEGQE